MILHQENTKQCYNDKKNSRIFSIFLNCVSMRVNFFKCVSKFVNCVSARVQMRENHAICVRVGNPVLRESSRKLYSKTHQIAQVTRNLGSICYK